MDCSEAFAPIEKRYPNSFKKVKVEVTPYADRRTTIYSKGYGDKDTFVEVE